MLNNIPKDILAGIEYLIACFPCNSLFTSTPPSQERLQVVLNILNQCKQEEISNRNVYLNLAGMDQTDLLPEEVLAGIATLLSRQVGFSCFIFI